MFRKTDHGTPCNRGAQISARIDRISLAGRSLYTFRSFFAWFPKCLLFSEVIEIFQNIKFFEKYYVPENGSRNAVQSWRTNCVEVRPDLISPVAIYFSKIFHLVSEVFFFISELIEIFQNILNVVFEKYYVPENGSRNAVQ